MHVRVATWLAYACVVAAGLFFFLDNKADVDLWGNVGFVKRLPWQDGFGYLNTYSYTEPSAPWINHEWLSEWVLSHLHHYLGNAGLLAYKLVLGCILLAWMNRSMCRQGCGGATRFFLLLLILSTIGYGFGVRPHLGTYLLMALTVEWIRTGATRRLSHVPCLCALGGLWANWHGAFFIGALLLLVDGCLGLWNRSGRERWFTWVSLCAFLLGTLCNPHGPALWSFVFSSASIVRPFLSEWAPLRWNEAVGVHIDFMLLALLIGASVVVSRKRQSLDVCLLLLSLIAAVGMRRNIPLFALMAGLVGGTYVQDMIGPALSGLMSRLSLPLRSSLAVAGTLFGLWATVAFNKTAPLELEVDPARFPVSAMAFIARHDIDGNAIVFFDWAEEFIWHRQTGSHVFLDGRFCSAYSRRTMDDYQRFIYGMEPWDTALTAYPTDMVLIHQGNPACVRMRQQPGWTVAYEDALCALFLKTSIHSAVLRDVSEGWATEPSSHEGNPWLFP